MPNRNSFSYKVRRAVREPAIGITFVPDGYVIDPETRSVILYEDVKTHDLNEKKLQKLGRFWADMDAYEWDVFLIVRHWYGAESEIDLGRIYYEHTIKGEIKCER